MEALTFLGDKSVDLLLQGDGSMGGEEFPQELGLQLIQSVDAC